MAGVTSFQPHQDSRSESEASSDQREPRHSRRQRASQPRLSPRDVRLPPSASEGGERGEDHSRRRTIGQREGESSRSRPSGETPGREPQGTPPMARRLFDDDEAADPITAVKKMLRQPPPGVSNVARAGSWLNNIGQLLDSAHRNTAGGRRRNRTRSKGQTSAPTASRSYSVSTPRRTKDSDLRENLSNRRREGEDACIIIERSRERVRESCRGSPERAGGRARERHSAERSHRRSMSYSSSSDSESSPERHPRRGLRTKSSAYTGGCAAWSTRLRQVTWPHKFCPDLPERFDGTAPPAEFLQIYSTRHGVEMEL